MYEHQREQFRGRLHHGPDFDCCCFHHFCVTLKTLLLMLYGAQVSILCGQIQYMIRVRSIPDTELSNASHGESIHKNINARRIHDTSSVIFCATSLTSLKITSHIVRFRMFTLCLLKARKHESLCLLHTSKEISSKQSIVYNHAFPYLSHWVCCDRNGRIWFHHELSFAL